MFMFHVPGKFKTHVIGMECIYSWSLHYQSNIKVDSLNFEQLKVLADDIGELGVEKVTFLANE